MSRCGSWAAALPPCCGGDPQKPNRAHIVNLLLLQSTIAWHLRIAQIFRHLERCTHHQVLHEEPAAGRRLVESEHMARWSLLGLSGLLQTRQAMAGAVRPAADQASKLEGMCKLLLRCSCPGSWRYQLQSMQRLRKSLTSHASMRQTS